MDPLHVLSHRRSTPSRALAEPGPDAHQLAAMLACAVHVPDHGKLAPWRFLLIRGAARQSLGELLAARSLERFPGAVVSGERWVDVMNPVADKGLALRHVQETLGVTREQTMAFGDYFNDVGLLDASAWSFAMDNAHPEVRAHARFVAPSNTANGVVRTIRSVLAL